MNAYHDSHSPDVSAAASGGALFGNSGASLLIAYGTVMSGNTAMTGGAVHCDSCQQLTMTTGSRLESNHAAEGGGACCITCECVLFQDVHFLNNRCVTGLVQSDCLCWRATNCIASMSEHLLCQDICLCTCVSEHLWHEQGGLLLELSIVLCICSERAAHLCEQHVMLQTLHVRFEQVDSSNIHHCLEHKAMVLHTFQEITSFGNEPGQQHLH